MLRFALIGDAIAQDNFFVHPGTGQVFLKIPLSESQASVFTVSSHIFMCSLLVLAYDEIKRACSQVCINEHLIKYVSMSI